MQWIRFNRDDGFDYEVVSNEEYHLDNIIKQKKNDGITIISDEIINETVIVEFSDGEIYSWCDDIFSDMLLV